jgi:hypothetical protein
MTTALQVRTVLIGVLQAILVRSTGSGRNDPDVTALPNWSLAPLGTAKLQAVMPQLSSTSPEL